MLTVESRLADAITTSIWAAIRPNYFPLTTDSAYDSEAFLLTLARIPRAGAVKKVHSEVSPVAM